MTKKLILLAPLAIVAMAVFIAIGGGLVMLLWNWLGPALFGLRQITLWQALGLLLLCRILFGSLGLGRGGVRSNAGRRISERWEQMTPEEREKCRRSFFGRWGRMAPPDTKPGA